MERNMRKIITTLIVVCAALIARTASAEGYSFKLSNTTENTIKKILVSEDGKKWGPFDIGKGIKPGETVTLEWAESTNDESCEQQVKAVFDDGSESEVTAFNFCEADLALEF